jgi:hypothetical protein
VNTKSANPWRDVTAAKMAKAHLGELAPLRDSPTIRVHVQEGAVWVVWSGDCIDIIRCLLPVLGVEFYVNRAGLWFRFRSLLPSVEAPPDRDGLPLSAVLQPQPFVSQKPEAMIGKPARLSIVRCSEPKPVSALVCSIGDLQKWADQATTFEISSVKGARTTKMAILLGTQLPSIPNGIRHWGNEVFLPIGFRTEPDLPPAAVRMVVGAESDELVFLTNETLRVVPRKAFESLSRAGIRLAAERVEMEPSA